MTPLPPVAAIRAETTQHEQTFVRLLEHVVNLDSPSSDAVLVNRVADAYQELLVERDWTVDRLELPETEDGFQAGDALVARLRGVRPDAPRILLVSHMDTVYEAGTAAERPFRIDDGRAIGPGVADDKCGFLAGLLAVDALRDAGFEGWSEIVFLLTPDEEAGSPASDPLIAEVAATADVALCLEAARENGDIVCARKGAADLIVDIQGRAAHAGVEPERGHSAAVHAAHLALALEQVNGLREGVTCNVGVIRAGTLPNVVAERARILADLRAWSQDDLDMALGRIEEIVAEPHVDGVTATLTLGPVFPPMEPTAPVERMVAWAKEIAGTLEIELDATATGGAADGSRTSAAGLPTLDGLAPIGGDDHSPDEWLDLSSVVPRLTLLAALIARIATDDPTRPSI